MEEQAKYIVPDDKICKHVMVDIETLGTTSNSAIIKIAAVKFNIDTAETGDTFLINVRLDSCIKAGLKIDPSTVLWWLKQDKDAIEAVFDNAEDGDLLRNALIAFSNWLDHGPWYTRGYQMWGNSARFDLGLLSDAFRALDMEVPWDFRKERCVRTLVSFAPEIKDEMPFEGIKHDPMADCLHQIKYCSKIWNTLNNK